MSHKEKCGFCLEEFDSEAHTNETCHKDFDYHLEEHWTRVSPGIVNDLLVGLREAMRDIRDDPTKARHLARIALSDYSKTAKGVAIREREME